MSLSIEVVEDSTLKNMDGVYYESNSKSAAGRWTQEEHELFLKGLQIYNKQWKLIADMIKTRTVVQIRTHAQKYFQRLQKMDIQNLNGYSATDGTTSPIPSLYIRTSSLGSDISDGYANITDMESEGVVVDGGGGEGGQPLQLLSSSSLHQHHRVLVTSTSTDHLQPYKAKPMIRKRSRELLLNGSNNNNNNNTKASSSNPKATSTASSTAVAANSCKSPKKSSSTVKNKDEKFIKPRPVAYSFDSSIEASNRKHQQQQHHHHSHYIHDSSNSNSMSITADQHQAGAAGRRSFTMIDNMDNSSRVSIMLYDHDHHLPHHHHHDHHHMSAATDPTRCSSDESKQQSAMIDSEFLSLLLDSDFLNDDRDDDDGSSTNNNNNSSNSGPPSYSTCCPSMSQERMIIPSSPGSLMGSMTMPISTTHQYQYQSGLDSLHSSCSTSDSLQDLSLTTLDICSDDADPHEDIDFIGCFIDADYISCYEGEEEEYRGGSGGDVDDYMNEFSISSTSGTSISSSRGGPCPCSPASMKKRGRPKKIGGSGGGRRGGSGSTHQLTHKEYIARLQHQGGGEEGPHLSTATTTTTTIVLDAHHSHPPHHSQQSQSSQMLRRVDSDYSSEGNPFSPTSLSSSSSSSITEMNPNHSSYVDYSCLYDDVDTYFGVVEQHHHHQQRSMMIPACVYNMTMSTSNMDPITATTAATTIASAVRTFSDKINGPFLNGIPPSSSSLFFTPEDQFSEFNLPFEFLGDNFD